LKKSNRELISELLQISEMHGESIQDLLESIPDERAMLVKEIAERYGEKKIKGESFNNSRQVFDHFKRLIHAQQEEFHVLLLDNKNRIISERMISRGTLNQSLVHPREIYSPAIEQRAAAIILIHNHPSLDPKPSTQDLEITKRLCEVGKLVGIKITDHVIIGENYFSFVDEEIMPD
jgi:DNA repair protein RadC